MFPGHSFSPDEGLPPREVRLTELRIEPWEDGRRMRVHVGLTPFQKRPNLNTVITDLQGEELASAVIVEVMDIRLVFTMHLRAAELDPQYRLTASLSYEEEGVVDERTITFEPTTGRGEDA